MADTPDIAGFVDAHQRLRAELGETVTFLEPLEVSFPPGTPIDPETGEPYDPVITASARATASGAQTDVRCSVSFKPLSGQEVIGGAGGFRDRTHVMVIAGIEYREQIEACGEFLLRGERYSITAQKPDDAFGDVADRWLVFGRRE